MLDRLLAEGLATWYGRSWIKLDYYLLALILSSSTFLVLVLLQNRSLMACTMI